MERFLLLLAARFVTAGIVAVLASMIASLYYVDIDGDPADVMDTRPNAPGSARALLAEHQDHCTPDGALEGPLSGALVRVRPNGPFVYASALDHVRPRLFIRAVEQQFQGKDRGIDTILAFCSVRPTG